MATLLMEKREVAESFMVEKGRFRHKGMGDRNCDGSLEYLVFWTKRQDSRSDQRSQSRQTVSPIVQDLLCVLP